MNNQTLSLDEVKRRAVKSFISLSGRQILLRGISFLTINVILAKILPVSTIGIFDIAASIVAFFAFFSDIGLAASLIQKKEDITSQDIKTVFTIQLLLVGVLSLLIIGTAQWVGPFFKLDNEGVWLIRVLGLTFFLSSLKVVPSVLLERNLNFNPLVTVDVIETLMFNVLLVIFVLRGLGVESFSIATLAQSLSGLVLIYILAPIKIGLGIDRDSAKKLFSFGIPFQINNILALLKDRLVPIVIARMVGPIGVGYITWSQSMAFLPLDLMNIVIRISFPTFSRLQDDKKSLSVAIEKSLFITAITVYPIIFGLAAIMPAVVTYITTTKWQPALPSFYLFALSTLFSVVSTVFTNALNAMGNIRVTLKLMIFWTILTWILTPGLVYFYGFVGAAISSFIISLTSIATIYLTKRVVEVKLFDALLLPIASSLIMFLAVYIFSQNLIRDRLTLGMAIIVGVVVYVGLITLFGRKKILLDLRSLKHV